MIVTRETLSVRSTSARLTWNELGLHPCLCSERLGINCLRNKIK